jgi:hypothetical protein
MQSYDILLPPDGTTPEATVRSAIDLTFDLLEHGYCPSATASSAKLECGLVRDARGLSIAVLDRQLPQAIIAAASLLQRAMDAKYPESAGDLAGDEQRKAFRKVTAVLGAVTSYTATYTRDAKGDPAQVAGSAVREAPETMECHRRTMDARLSVPRHARFTRADTDEILLEDLVVHAAERAPGLFPRACQRRRGDPRLVGRARGYPPRAPEGPLRGVSPTPQAKNAREPLLRGPFLPQDPTSRCARADEATGGHPVCVGGSSHMPMTVDNRA